MPVLTALRRQSRGMVSLRPTRETYRESVKRQGGLRELGEEKEEKMKKGGKEKRQRKGNSTPLWKEMTCSGHLGSGDEGQVLSHTGYFPVNYSSRFDWDGEGSHKPPPPHSYPCLLQVPFPPTHALFLMVSLPVICHFLIPPSLLPYSPLSTNNSDFWGSSLDPELHPFSHTSSSSKDVLLFPPHLSLTLPVS